MLLSLDIHHLSSVIVHLSHQPIEIKSVKSFSEEFEDGLKKDVEDRKSVV